MQEVKFPIDTTFKDPLFGLEIDHKGEAKILILTNDDLHREYREAFKAGKLTIEQITIHHFMVEKQVFSREHYVLFAAPDGKLKVIKFREKIYQ